MALTITEFGTGAQNQPYILQAVSDDADTKTVQIIVGGVLIENEPEIGTSDTFRFELMSITRNLLNTQMLDLANITSITTFTLPVFYSFIPCVELDEDKENISATPQGAVVVLYPFNFFRGQNTSTFFTDDNGSVNNRFLTNAPNLQRVKRGDLFSLAVAKGGFSGANEATANQIIRVIEFDENDNVVNFSITNIIPPQQTISIPFGTQTRRVAPFGITFPITLNPSVKRIVYEVQDQESPFTPRSEIRTLIVDDSCLDEYKVYWLNQYGVCEISYFKGNVKRVNSVDRKTFVEAEPINPTFSQGGLKNYENELTLQWELNTSRLKQKEIEYLAEILHSTNIVIEYKGELVQVVCTNSNLNTFDNFNDIDFLTFQFTESKSTKFFV